MVRAFILRGFGVGALGGIFAFVFARIFAEPQIQRAIDYESGRDAAQEALDKTTGMAMSDASGELFSRTIQGNLGIGVGMVAFGLALGGLYSVGYVLAYGRTGALKPRSLAVMLAFVAFVAIYLVPFLKYPANPPAIGHPDTIGSRGGLYLLMVLASLGFALLAVWCGRLLRVRFGNWNATLLAVLAYIVAMAAVMLVLPAFGQLQSNLQHYGNFATETPQPLLDPHGTIVYPGFPADVLFDFRLYSVGAQAILWITIGLCFAPLSERVIARHTLKAQPVR